MVEAVGDGVTRVGVGQHVALSWAPSCGRCAECLDDLPHLCGTAWPMMAQGTLLDGTTRLSRGGEPVYHYSFISSFAERTVLPEASCVPIPEDVPARGGGAGGLCGHDRRSAPCSAQRAGARRLQRAAVVGCGGVGLSAVMGLGRRAGRGRQIIAVDLHEGRLEAALSLGATDAVQAAATAEETAERVREASAGGVDVAIEATGRSDAMRAAFLSTRRRGTAVLIGIPAEDAVLELPALSIPRMERRVMGALYGSARPERDFVVILDQYARGRLPLDRLISHRLPLDGIGEAFDLLRSGSGRRVVLELADQS